MSAGRSQCCHLVLLEASHDVVLAQRIAATWTLPFSHAPLRERHTEVVRRALRTLGLRGRLAAVFGGVPDWRADTLHVCCIVELARESRLPPRYERLPLTDLHEDLAFLPYQAARVAEYAALRSSVPTWHPLSPGWHERVMRWVEAALAAEQRRPNDWAVTHRAGVGRFVAQLGTTTTPVYVKAGDTISHEAETATLVRSAYPELVPRTLAFDRSQRSWLTDHLAGRRFPQGASSDVLVSLVRALASIESRVRAQMPSLRAAGIPELDWKTVGATSSRLLATAAQAGALDDAQHARSHEALGELMRRAAGLDVPSTWIHTDICPENLVVSEGRPGMVDLDPPHLGPPYVTCELAIRRCAPHCTPDTIAALRECYAAIVQPRLSPRARREFLEIAGAATDPMVEVATVRWMDRSLACGEMIERGPVFDARVGRRLARRLIGEIPMLPAPQSGSRGACVAAAVVDDERSTAR